MGTRIVCKCSQCCEAGITSGSSVVLPFEYEIARYAAPNSRYYWRVRIITPIVVRFTVVFSDSTVATVDVATTGAVCYGKPIAAMNADDVSTLATTNRTVAGLPVDSINISSYFNNPVAISHADVFFGSTSTGAHTPNIILDFPTGGALGTVYRSTYQRGESAGNAVGIINYAR